jgi:SAM-dependent methyltransferase
MGFDVRANVFLVTNVVDHDLPLISQASDDFIDSEAIIVPISKISKSELKKLYQKALNSVQDSHTIHDADVAKLIMKELGYSEADIDLAGVNVPLFSGVANPFDFVKIKEGDEVLHL